MKNKNAFTIVEIIIGLAVLSVVVGISIIMMTRSAANVQRGSFNALAANQAFWIVTTMRNDISRVIGDIEFPENKIWTGEGDFKFNIEGGKVEYFIVNNGNRKLFKRKFTKKENIKNMPFFNDLNDREQRFGDEYLDNIEVKKEDGKEEGKQEGKDDICYVVTITMKEPKDNTDNGKTFITTATIYLPKDDALKNKYWVPTVEKDE